MNFFTTRCLLATLTIITMTGCVKSCGHKGPEDLSPEEVVEQYLEIALNMTSIDQKKALLFFTTGPLNAAIRGTDDETIRTSYLEKNYALDRYTVVERKDRTPRETEITFELAYRDLGDKSVKLEDAVSITTENTVSVVRSDGRWMIQDVLNKKSSFDFPTSQASVITPNR